MNFLPDWAPGIHPLIIHFPIAIIAIALVADLLTLFFKAHQFKLSVLFLYVMGALGALVSFLSGRAAADSLNIPEGYYDVYPVISAHADMAFYVILFFGLYTLLRIILYIYDKDNNRYVFFASFVVGLFGYFLVFLTAEKGAELVYRYGMGTQIISQIDPENNIQADKNKEIQENNNASEWLTKKEAESVLKKQFTQVIGDINNIAVNDNSGTLSINIFNDGKYLLLGSNNFSDVVVESEFNIDSFQGRFSLIHHFSDSSTYDFCELNKKNIRLGRIENSKIHIFDDASITSESWSKLKAVGTQGHFRGYINNSLNVHGHADDLPPGKTGILISGKGLISIRNLQSASTSGNKTQSSEKHSEH